MHGQNELAPDKGAPKETPVCWSCVHSLMEAALANSYSNCRLVSDIWYVTSKGRSQLCGPTQVAPLCLLWPVLTGRIAPRRPAIYGVAGTPFWKLVLKQFDDLLVKVCADECAQHSTFPACRAAVCRTKACTSHGTRKLVGAGPHCACPCADSDCCSSRRPDHSTAQRRERVQVGHLLRSWSPHMTVHAGFDTACVAYALCEGGLEGTALPPRPHYAADSQLCCAACLSSQVSSSSSLWQTVSASAVVP